MLNSGDFVLRHVALVATSGNVGIHQAGITSHSMKFDHFWDALNRLSVPDQALV